MTFWLRVTGKLSDERLRADEAGMLDRTKATVVVELQSLCAAPSTNVGNASFNSWGHHSIARHMLSANRWCRSACDMMRRCQSTSSAYWININTVPEELHTVKTCNQISTWKHERFNCDLDPLSSQDHHRQSSRQNIHDGRQAHRSRNVRKPTCPRSILTFMKAHDILSQWNDTVDSRPRRSAIICVGWCDVCRYSLVDHLLNNLQ